MSNFRREYQWVPSVYFMQGVPYAVVTTVSSILYKNFNFNNGKIAFYTSLFAIPWFLKPLISPFLERKISKRKLTVGMQFVMTGLFLLLALSFIPKDFFYNSSLIFFAIALASSIHDINSDGLYIINLNSEAQAYFIGIRTLCYQLGKLFAQGGLVFLVGIAFFHYKKTMAWQINIILLSVFYFLMAAYHQKNLPRNKTDMSKKELVSDSFKNFISDFIKIPYLFSVLLFILFYNLPEAQLLKIVPLFLMDTNQYGGLGLSLKSVGIIYGTIGATGMLIGIVWSGFLLKKFSLKRCLVPATAFMALSNISYEFLSIFLYHSVWVITFFITVAAFGFGLSNGAYMFYLLKNFARGTFPMSLYALGTALMGLSVTAGGAVSGFLQTKLGYQGFFIWIILLSFFMVFIAFNSSKKIA